VCIGREDAVPGTVSPGRENLRGKGGGKEVGQTTEYETAEPLEDSCFESVKQGGGYSKKSGAGKGTISFCLTKKSPNTY